MTEIIDEIISAVLRDNLSILRSAPQDYEFILTKYAKVFFDKIRENSKTISYGLQLGLTKKFVEFCLKDIINSGEQPKSKAIDSILKNLTSQTIQQCVEMAENDAIVYIMYRSLKKTINKEFEQLLETCK